MSIKSIEKKIRDYRATKESLNLVISGFDISPSYSNLTFE